MRAAARDRITAGRRLRMAARESVADAATASFPSTLPALEAKLTAAMLVPPKETKSAVQATAMAGEGLVMMRMPGLTRGTGA